MLCAQFIAPDVGASEAAPEGKKHCAQRLVTLFKDFFKGGKEEVGSKAVVNSIWLF